MINNNNNINFEFYNSIRTRLYNNIWSDYKNIESLVDNLSNRLNEKITLNNTTYDFDGVRVNIILTSQYDQDQHRICENISGCMADVIEANTDQFSLEELNTLRQDGLYNLLFTVTILDGKNIIFIL